MSAYNPGSFGPFEAPSVTLVLPYPVSANLYWRTFRGRQVVSAEAKAFKTEVAIQARAAGMTTPLRGWVSATVRVYPKLPGRAHLRMKADPTGWESGVRCMDIDNALKVLIDALNGIAWHDDSQLRRITVERCTPDGEARSEIEVSPE